MMRAEMSVPPPGDDGTTSRIDRVGYCCAHASPIVAMPASARAVLHLFFFIEALLVFYRWE
jgi:hypothetical protein